MKPPSFNLKTLLPATAFIAIVCGNIVLFGNRSDGIPMLFGLSAALWIPLVFAAHAIGSRSVSLQQAIAFAIAQAAAIGISAFCLGSL